jgi:hypothetical protein
MQNGNAYNFNLTITTEMEIQSFKVTMATQIQRHRCMDWAPMAPGSGPENNGV